MSNDTVEAIWSEREFGSSPEDLELMQRAFLQMKTEVPPPDDAGDQLLLEIHVDKDHYVDGGAQVVIKPYEIALARYRVHPDGRLELDM